MLETWRQIPGHNMFEVSDHGNVRRPDARKKWNGSGWQILPAKTLSCVRAKKTGYLVVNFDRKVHYVHRLVAEAFLPESPFFGMDVNHIDGCKQNNHVINLEWCNRKHNIDHAFRTGLNKTGEAHHSAKHSSELVRAIRDKHKETGLSPAQLKKRFFPDIPRTTISSFIHLHNRKREVAGTCSATPPRLTSISLMI